MRLVLVKWVDSFGASAHWQSIDGFSREPIICNSVGWLVAETNDCIAVVPHLSEEGRGQIPQQGCGDMTIPTRSIVSIEDLKSASRRQK